MKEPDQTLKAILLSAGPLLMVAWIIIFLAREHGRITDHADQVIAEKLAEEALEPQRSASHGIKKMFGLRNHKRFANDLERRIWENTPDDLKAIEEAHGARDFEEFDRLGREFAMKAPWEWEPPPWVVKLREKNGWTNDPVFIDGPPLSREESEILLGEMEKYFNALREFHPSSTNTMPPPSLWKRGQTEEAKP